MNPGVAIRGRGLQVLEEIVHAAFADGAGALLHRPIGELAQRSEYSAKVDAAAAERSRTFRVAGIERILRVKAFAIGIRRRVHAFALQSESVVQIEIGLLDVVRQLIGRTVAPGLLDDDFERPADLRVVAKSIEICLQQRIGAEDRATDRERSGRDLFVAKRQAGPVQTDEKRTEVRKNRIRLCAIGGACEGLDPKAVLLLGSGHIAFPAVTKEEYVGDLVRPRLVNQALAHQSTLFRYLFALGIKADQAVLNVSAGNCFEAHAVPPNHFYETDAVYIRTRSEIVDTNFAPCSQLRSMPIANTPKTVIDQIVSYQLAVTSKRRHFAKRSYFRSMTSSAISNKLRESVYNSSILRQTSARCSTLRRKQAP